MSDQGLQAAIAKMEAAGVAPAAVGTFARLYRLAETGATGYFREEDVSPLPQLDVPHEVSAEEAAVALGKTAIMKLNGGLGTSMGMEKAKSLLPVLPGPDGEVLTFLDVIVGQIRAARAATGARLPLLFMDSFRTQAETLDHLSRYEDLPVDNLPLSVLQNREPKLTADTLEPVSWPANPNLEWCPPGHGDLYPVLHATGTVKKLLDAGFEYLSVANADNLGSYPSAEIAAWFAASGAPYAAEMCLKTPADVKGGQLVVRNADGQIVQRETAQTHPDDMEASLNADVHRYFHTNNLWFNLRALDDELNRTGGVLELPLIRNEKTVDPTDPKSTPVIQLESAMGAAVAVFKGATAVEVPRARFLPVKATTDLLLIRSDLYHLTGDFRLEAQGPAPLIKLSNAYKNVADFDTRFAAGAPSLVAASSLTVDGDWTFGADVRAVGAAHLSDTGTSETVPDGATVAETGVIGG